MQQRTPPNSLTPFSPTAGGWINKLALLQPGEGPLVIWSALYFFLILTSFYLLRPLREAMGIDRGADKLPWLMTGTMTMMLLANPAFAWLVSRWPRRRFIPITHRLFALQMLTFFALFRWLPAHGGVNLGYVFYVWLSVFNLFVVSVFWALMADLYSTDQSKRLFGMIAIGGSLGATAGAGLTAMLADGLPAWTGIHARLDVSTLFMVAAVFLELAVICVRRLFEWSAARNEGDHAETGASTVDGVTYARMSYERPAAREPSPRIMDGLRLIARSPMLQLICLYIFLFAVCSTFLYMAQGGIVERTFSDRAARAAAFARMDFWTNALTFAMQLLLTGRIVSSIGMGGTLLVLPLLTIAGFAGLWIMPVYAMLFVIQVSRRALHYALDRPAREALFTLVGPDGKYKSKPFIDTFVYRGGDMLGGWVPLWLGMLGVGVAPAGLAVSGAWLVCAWLLRATSLPGTTPTSQSQ